MLKRELLKIALEAKERRKQTAPLRRATAEQKRRQELAQARRLKRQHVRELEEDFEEQAKKAAKKGHKSFKYKISRNVEHVYRYNDAEILLNWGKKNKLAIELIASATYEWRPADDCAIERISTSVFRVSWHTKRRKT